MKTKSKAKTKDKTKKKTTSSRSSSNQKGVTKPRSTAKKAPQSSTKKEPAKKAPVKKPAVTNRKNPFDGASEISIMATKFAVTKQVSSSKNGSYSATEKRVYLDKTPANMAYFNEAMAKKAPRKVTVKY